MPKSAERYHMSGQALSILRREGTGWSHDMERGSLYMPAARRPTGALARIAQRFKKGH